MVSEGCASVLDARQGECCVIARIHTTSLCCNHEHGVFLKTARATTREPAGGRLVPFLQRRAIRTTFGEATGPSVRCSRGDWIGIGYCHHSQEQTQEYNNANDWKI